MGSMVEETKSGRIVNVVVTEDGGVHGAVGESSCTNAAATTTTMIVMVLMGMAAIAVVVTTMTMDVALLVVAAMEQATMIGTTTEGVIMLHPLPPTLLLWLDHLPLCRRMAPLPHPTSPKPLLMTDWIKHERSSNCSLL